MAKGEHLFAGRGGCAHCGEPTGLTPSGALIPCPGRRRAPWTRQKTLAVAAGVVAAVVVGVLYQVGVILTLAYFYEP
jgi:hypothetical protein